MANEAQETKIELVTEAIEALVLATVVATLPSPADSAERRANHQNIVDARAAVAKALATCLAPTLRIAAASNEHRGSCTKDRCHCGPQ